jgi:hypothetical protein
MDVFVATAATDIQKDAGDAGVTVLLIVAVLLSVFLL